MEESAIAAEKTCAPLTLHLTSNKCYIQSNHLYTKVILTWFDVLSNLHTLHAHMFTSLVHPHVHLYVHMYGHMFIFTCSFLRPTFSKKLALSISMLMNRINFSRKVDPKNEQVKLSRWTHRCTCRWRTSEHASEHVMCTCEYTWSQTAITLDSVLFSLHFMSGWQVWQLAIHTSTDALGEVWNCRNWWCWNSYFQIAGPTPRYKNKKETGKTLDQKLPNYTKQLLVLKASWSIW